MASGFISTLAQIRRTFPTFSALSTSEVTLEAASFSDAVSSSRRTLLNSSVSCLARCTRSSAFGALSTSAASLMSLSCSPRSDKTPIPVTPSIRLTPAATEDSDVILNKPSFAVLSTCVPPQSSVENSPILTTRTTSPYFSPNSAIAPIFLADSISESVVVTGSPSRMYELTSDSTARSSSGVTAAKCVKSKRTWCSSTYEPACSTCLPRTVRSAACKRCAAEWLRMVATRLVSLISARTVSPFFNVPLTMRQKWIYTPSVFLVSKTVTAASPPVMIPTSPTCPPLSA